MGLGLGVRGMGSRSECEIEREKRSEEKDWQGVANIGWGNVPVVRGVRV